MSWDLASRQERLNQNNRADPRNAFQRDRDRILYSSAFRRLAGITQIVRAGEADVFHTRQQHTLKVAQIGLRVAQAAIRDQPRESAYYNVDPEVVEAASLAHDLGHPPFGHVGEHVLHDLVVKHDTDGFEGNAQSFRILVSLSVRFEDQPGLNLTRATLAACLKYPWLRDENVPTRLKKWGAYKAEQRAFAFAREHFSHSYKTVEAEIMDWADDVAYSVHDLEDFHRCGVIPWMSIFAEDKSHRTEIVNRATKNWFAHPNDARDKLDAAFERLTKYLLGPYSSLFSSQYEGTREQRQQLRTMTSDLIGRYSAALKLKEPEAANDGCPLVNINDEEQEEVKILKQITRDYITSHPSLVAQQKGQERIIYNLFDMIYKDADHRPPRYLPKRLHYLWDDDIFVSKARAASDCISSLTEAEVVGLHNRLQGTSSGSVLDPIVR